MFVSLGRPVLVGVIAVSLAPVASAGQQVGGTYLEAYYGNNGLWNWNTYAAGLRVRASSSASWVDVTYPGTPFTHLHWEYSYGGTAYGFYANSVYGNTVTTTLEDDLSTSTTNITRYEYSDGRALEVRKIEYWDDTSKAMWLGLEIENVGTSNVTNFRVIHAIDPDQDALTYGYYNTYNDVQDLDADGTNDWDQSVGPYSGYTVGYGRCQSGDTFGHNASWSQDADATLTDYNGSSGDYAMYWRYGHGTSTAIAPGERVVVGTIFAWDTSASSAQGQYSTAYAGGLCDVCDEDGDGHLSEDCGGDDCDDTDASVNTQALEYCDGVDNDCDGTVDEDDAVDASTWWYDGDADGYGDATISDVACDAPSGYVDNPDDCDDDDPDAYPGATEVPYDGIDQDCDGQDLCDVDGDGFDAPECGGTDCDDFDDTVYPTAEEVWYDGTDQDCDGWSDYDADYDGYDSDLYGGDDCDDDDYDINPDATEIWYDGVDQDCDGASDYDADGDGYDAERYGGEDCDDDDATVYPGAPELDDGIDNDCNGLTEDDDTDGDGVPDEDELVWGTDPDSADSDGDGVPDGIEIGDGEEPRDSDGDGTIDALDTDDDDDGIPTIDEIGDYDWTTDDESDIPDTDDDGTPDYLDLDSDADGYPDAEEGDVDTDGDGTPDFLDLDSDDDGVFDLDERHEDTDGDGTDNRLDNDDDDDAIPTLDEGDESVDTDDDGTPDYLDPDSDDDGILDVDEGQGDNDCDGIPNYIDADDHDGPCTDPLYGADNYFRGGCGCAAAPGPSAVFSGLLALMGLVGIRRRRRG